MAALLLALGWPMAADAQELRIRDVTLQDQNVPVRLVGYGIVVGLEGTGDRVTGGRNGGHTVQSVANLLRRFDVEVPAEVMRMRNVAAVLVTAEVSPYLRPGGRFEAQISSMGDARSLRGGVLWMTPLVADVGGYAVATVQGPLLLGDNGAGRARGGPPETSARIPSGGILEVDLPRPAFANVSRLLLRQPDLGTAMRIADAINAQIGAGAAAVEDPGAVALQLPGGPADHAMQLTRIGELRITPDRAARVVINARDGTVVAGGELTVGEATVSHGVVTLTIGAAAAGGGAPGDVRVAVGTPVQEVAAALHGVQAMPHEIAAIFEALREVGALGAEVTVR